MNFLARGLVLFGLSLLATSVFAQSELDAAILKVNGQEVFQSDLELVKIMLPLERYKTTRARTNLIDSVYVEFLIEKTLLEQRGLQKITEADVAEFRRSAESTEDTARIKDLGYSNPEGYFAKNLLRFTIERKLSQDYAAQNPNVPGTQVTYNNPDNPEEKERAITASLQKLLDTPEVSFQAMLLEDIQQVEVIRKMITQGRSFSDLSDSYSLVHHYSGGAYNGGSDDPHILKLSVLEPELQVEISQIKKPGFYVFKAPFKRYWFIKIHQFPAKSPFTLFGENTQSYSVSSRVLSTKGFSSDKARRKATIEFIDSRLRLINPLIAKIGNMEIYLSEYFSEQLFDNETNIFETRFTSLESSISEFIKSHVIYKALPYGGAGVDSNLQAYLAARVKVSADQLKFFYLKNRKNYNFREDEFQMGCSFTHPNPAKYWRTLFISNPTSTWIEKDQRPFYFCDIEGEAENPPMPELPSKGSLTPIPGGFITNVGQSRNTYYFLVLYKYQPQPLPKPFALARGQVEFDYRNLVAEKRMPQFWQALKNRVGVQYKLKEAMQELENAGK
jgi:hypothetical protein